MNSENRRAARADRYDHARLALRWYFGDKGRGGRTAGFICHIMLLALTGWLFLTLFHLGSLVLTTIASLYSAEPAIREATIHALKSHSALEYVNHVGAILRGQIPGDLLLSLALATLVECAYTVRRAQRQMPPIEFLARAIRESERPA